MANIVKHNVPRSGRIAATEFQLRRLQPGVVLELGAGDYSFSYLFREKPYVRWIHADFAQPTDLLIDFNTPKVTLPLSDSSVDLVIATEVLEHLFWPQALLRECVRVLRTGGKLLVSVPNAVSLTYRLAWVMGHVPSCAACGNLPPGLLGPTTYLTSAGGHIGGHVIDFNAHRLVSLLQHSGYRVDRLRGSGLFWHRTIMPYWLVPPSWASNLIAVATPLKQ